MDSKVLEYTVFYRAKNYVGNSLLMISILHNLECAIDFIKLT